MKILSKILIILSFFLVSCGSYQTSSYRVKSVLAVTEKGDTIQVPIREFERQKYDTYTRFNWNNQWYWNNWRYDFNWGWQPWFFSYPNRYWWGNNLRYTNPSRGYRAPSRPKIQPKVRPRPRQPGFQPRPRVNPRSNQSTPRGYNQPRTRTTPNVQSRTNVGRRSNGVRQKQ